MPSGCDEAFSTWWKSKGSTDVVSVSYRTNDMDQLVKFQTPLRLTL